MAWTKQQPFQALALTGGGYRGLFTARALQAIEEHVGEPIGRRFDLVCGTSIGGIVALAVAFEVPMQRVVETFQARGLEIFPAHRLPTTTLGKVIDLVRHRSRARYSSEALRSVVADLLPEELTLGDALHPLAIPAVNVTLGRPQVFKSPHKREWGRDRHYKAVDVALATAAAPTFFPLAEVGNNLFADGGLFANAPDLVAIHEANYFFNVSDESFRLVSIGTTTKNYSISFTAGRDFGVLDWMENQRLIAVMIASQQQFVEQITEHRLKDRYVRIDHEPAGGQAQDLGLDIADETAQRTLIAFAVKAATDALGGPLRGFLDHRPQLQLIK